MPSVGWTIVKASVVRTKVDEETAIVEVETEISTEVQYRGDRKT